MNNSSLSNSTVLIVGKHAKTGWRVNRLLQEQGFETRAVSRSTSPAFDWEDQSTWQAAMQGTKSAYITYHPDLAIPAAEQAIKDFVSIAKQSGLQHLVLLSGRGEAGARRAELVLENSGLDWNVVRANWFMQNFSENFMIEGILNGELMLPAGDIPEPFVDVDDIAEVAVAALTRPELRNRVFEVSGPEALLFSECVAEISKAVGYPIKFTQVPVDAFVDGLREGGAADNLLWLMHELFTVVLDGRNVSTTDGIEEALGRPPTDFKAYVQKALRSGAWDRSGLQQLA